MRPVIVGVRTQNSLQTIHDLVLAALVLTQLLEPIRQLLCAGGQLLLTGLIVSIPGVQLPLGVGQLLILLVQGRFGLG